MHVIGLNITLLLGETKCVDLNETYFFSCRYLSALRGTIRFDLENRVDDEIDEVCDMDNRYYDLFDRGEKPVAMSIYCM